MPLNLICFRHKGGDEVNQQLMDRLNRSGDLYLTHTRLNRPADTAVLRGANEHHRPARGAGVEANSGRDWAAAGAPIFERTATTGLPRQDAPQRPRYVSSPSVAGSTPSKSEVMRQHATAAGLTNAAIVNTCAVTGEAVRQAAQTIRKLRREDPSVRIIVMGCAAQIDPGRFGAMTEVDAVIGNAEKMLPGTFQAVSGADWERVQVNDIMSAPLTA